MEGIVPCQSTSTAARVAGPMACTVLQDGTHTRTGHQAGLWQSNTHCIICILLYIGHYLREVVPRVQFFIPSKLSWMQNAPEILAILFIWFIFLLAHKAFMFFFYLSLLLLSCCKFHSIVKTLCILKANVGKVGSVVQVTRLYPSRQCHQTTCGLITTE